ncbi:MAG: phospholipase [Syntrophales bacterium LBB04]|nr:phospholipase [Syntrophales bacterium LBB04]
MKEAKTDPDAGELCTALLDALWAFEEAQRRYYPGIAPLLAERFTPVRENLVREMKTFASLGVSAHDPGIGRRLVETAALCADAFASSTEGDDFESAFINFMRAARRMARVKEMLFPLCTEVPAVNRFFLEEAVRDRPEQYVSDRESLPSGGLIHLGLDKHPYARGGCSIFIPPCENPSGGLPLVMALHGGFGHGRDFIWIWIREARSRGFVVAAPSSLGNTWSITGSDVDAGLLARVLQYVSDRWPVDPGRILLTGISDGATYALTRAMEKDAPFSAYGPIAGVLPPFDLRFVKGRRICWIHGARDWMFPWQFAKAGAQRLAQAGADVTLRIVPDLYHAYPGEQNDGLLGWFDPGLALTP